MIGLIIQAMKVFDYDEVTDTMKIAKGKHEAPTNWCEIKRYAKEKANGRR